MRRQEDDGAKKANIVGSNAKIKVGKRGCMDKREEWQWYDLGGQII
jgi:hypothetical protein